MFLPVQVPSSWTFTFSSSFPPSFPWFTSANHSFLQNTHVWSVRPSALQALLKGEVRVGGAEGGGDVALLGDLVTATPGATRSFKQVGHTE